MTGDSIYLIFTFIKVIKHSPAVFKLQLRTCCGICIVATHCSTCMEAIETKHEIKVANYAIFVMIFLKTKESTMETANRKPFLYINI